MITYKISFGKEEFKFNSLSTDIMEVASQAIEQHILPKIEKQSETNDGQINIPLMMMIDDNPDQNDPYILFTYEIFANMGKHDWAKQLKKFVDERAKNNE